MEKTESMIEFEQETGQTLEEADERGITLNFYLKYIQWLEAKATAYDRLMSGGKFTMKEMANIKKRPIAIDKDGTVNAHGAEPHLARGGFAGYCGCWVNDADDYEEIPESFVEIPDDSDWTTSLTLPDGWREK